MKYSFTLHYTPHNVNACLFIASAASTDGDQGEGDFPLSITLLEKKMKIGRTALNMASLALPRMTQTDGEVQSCLHAYIKNCFTFGLMIE